MDSPTGDDAAQKAATSQTAHRGHARRVARWALSAIVAYLGVAYLVMPFAWERYVQRHPSLDDNPRITTTGDGHPGDPLNVSLIGTKEQLQGILQTAGWRAAAALGVRSDLKIAADTLLSRPDVEAPVSSLYLFGRKEDLAFEQPVGDNPRQRHHVRFWKTAGADGDGRPVWLGSVTYDERVGLSHTTGQVTHHISGDIDDERDRLFGELEKTGMLEENWVVDDYHKQREGKNGGGDAWHTDGRLFVGRIEGPPDSE